MQRPPLFSSPFYHQPAKWLRLATAAEMRGMDQHAIEQLGIPGLVLMENAARAVTRQVRAVLKLDSANPPEPAHGLAPVAVCCGSGNNGGDGYAVARQLVEGGIPAVVVAVAPPATSDATANAKAWGRLGTTLQWPEDATATHPLLQQTPLVVDALFGTGLTRPLEGDVAALVAAINQAGGAGTPVLAVDVPSGVNADTGQVPKGGDGVPVAIKATETVTFQFSKPGLHQPPGSLLAGQVHRADISIPPHWPVGAPETALIGVEAAAGLVPPRQSDAHKGSYGHVLLVVGSQGMAGAAQLAAMGALRSGAGLVTLGVPPALQDRFVAAAPEAMTLTAPAAGLATCHEGTEAAAYFAGLAGNYSALVLGCGLGRSSQTAPFVEALLRAEPVAQTPLVIDADGLYALDPKWLGGRRMPAVLTPHPGEMARLSGLTVAEVQADRVAVARHWANQWQVVLVLKGAGTVVAHPGGEARLNTTGDDGLATGGTGDVLAGLIGGLLGRGMPPFEAAQLGVYLHGLARDLHRQGMAGPGSVQSPEAFVASHVVQGLEVAWRHLRRFSA